MYCTQSHRPDIFVGSVCLLDFLEINHVSEMKKGLKILEMPPYLLKSPGVCTDVIKAYFFIFLCFFI